MSSGRRPTPIRWLTRQEARHALGDMPERTFARWCAKGAPCKRSGDDGQYVRYPWPELFHWLIEQAGRQDIPAEVETEKEAEMLSIATAAVRVGVPYARIYALLATLGGVRDADGRWRMPAAKVEQMRKAFPATRDVLEAPQ